MRWTEITAPLLTKPAGAAPPPSARPPTPKTPSNRRAPGADHPWHHVVADYRTGRQLASARRAWLAVQP
jgi:hypothetical protein